MDYKAIYNTETIHLVEYDFTAPGNQEAIAFCERKFNAPDIFLLNRNTADCIHIGDTKVTHEIARAFFKKEGLPYED